MNIKNVESLKIVVMTSFLLFAASFSVSAFLFFFSWKQIKMLCLRSSATKLPQLQNSQDHSIPINPETKEIEDKKLTETMGSQENDKKRDNYNFEESELAFIESMGLTPEDMLDYLQLPVNIPSDEILHGK